MVQTTGKWTIFVFQLLIAQVTNQRFCTVSTTVNRHALDGNVGEPTVAVSVVLLTEVNCPPSTGETTEDLARYCPCDGRNFLRTFKRVLNFLLPDHHRELG